MNRTILHKAITALTLLAATPAAADNGVAWIHWSKDNPLIVLSNGESYTKIDTLIGDFVLRGQLQFDTDTVGAVKSWSAWPAMVTNYGISQEVPGLKGYKESKSYSVGSRPNSIDKTVEFAIPYAVIEPFAVGMCAWKAKALRDDGKSDKQIFGQDHEVTFEISMAANVDSTGAGQGNQIWEGSAPFILPVRCAKWTGAQAPQGGNNSLEDSLRVLTATMNLTEQTTASGVCRVKTATALRANKADATIEYRFVHSSGKKSPTFKIETESNKIAVINRTWDVPNEDGAETGWFHVEGVGTAFKTEKVPYQMQCPDKAPGGLTFGN